jgi:hypothetical protein
LFKNTIVDHCVDENCSLDIFELIINTNELAKELVNKKIFVFRRFQVDCKKYQMSFSMVRKINICVFYN